MKKHSIRFSFTALLVAFGIALAGVQLAAAGVGDEVEITGTVVSIDEGTGSFVVETEAGETLTVSPGEDLDFDLSTLQVGDTVEVEGTLDEDGSLTASKVHIEQQEEDGDPAGERDDPSGGYYCQQSEDRHPFGERLAAGYEVDYETLQGWFCDGYGWGQIMLALKTADITGEDFADLLGRRGDGEGWGQIWQDLKLIGRPEDAGPPNDEDGDGRPDFAGPPNDEDGDGIPDFAGPPNDEDGDGRPDFAGPPDGANGDGTGDAGPPAVLPVPGGQPQGNPGGPPPGIPGGRP